MKKLAIIVLAVFMWSCGSDESKISTDLVNNPASATEGTNLKEPKIEFEVMEYDFGNLMQEEKATYSYKFKNTGNAPLIISAVERTCGCTDIKYPREPIQPGGSGAITIIFDSKDKKGVQNKHVTVKANTNPSETVLKFKAMVMTP